MSWLNPFARGDPFARDPFAPAPAARQNASAPPARPPGGGPSSLTTPSTKVTAPQHVPLSHRLVMRQQQRTPAAPDEEIEDVDDWPSPQPPPPQASTSPLGAPPQFAPPSASASQHHQQQAHQPPPPPPPAASPLGAPFTPAAAAPSAAWSGVVQTWGGGGARSGLVSGLALSAEQRGEALAAGRGPSRGGGRRAAGAFGGRVAKAQAALAHEVQLLHVKHAILGGMPAAAHAVRGAMADPEARYLVLRLRRVLAAAPLVSAECELLEAPAHGAPALRHHDGGADGGGGGGGAPLVRVMLQRHSFERACGHGAAGRTFVVFAPWHEVGGVLLAQLCEPVDATPALMAPPGAPATPAAASHRGAF